MQEEIVYFEVNNWFSERDYPYCMPFTLWLRDANLDKYLGNAEFVKKNGICVCAASIDMSVSFLVTAPKKWVEENCPDILKPENEKFISDGQKVRYGFGHYLPYDDEHIGKIESDDGYWDAVANRSKIEVIEGDIEDALQDVKIPRGKLYKIELMVSEEGTKIVTITNGDKLTFEETEDKA